MSDQQLKKLAELAAKAPRQQNLALFVGRADGAFIDNAKYAFIHCSQHVPELESLFLCFDRKAAKSLKAEGLSVLCIEDDGALDILAKAGLVVCDDFWWKNNPLTYALLHPVPVVQLWHGIPLKAIGFPEIESTVNMNPEKAQHLRFSYSGYSAVLSTSPYFTEHAYAKAFRAEEYPELGYPRNDVLTRPPAKLDMINVDTELYREVAALRKQGYKTLVYMPTFRDTGGGPFEDGAFDVNRLNDFCVRNNILFICKFHPYIRQDKMQLPGNIRIMNSSSDIYPMLRLCDVLLTDYSSIYFDFLLVDRPMVFYPYDYENYITRNRELLFDYDTNTPGVRANTEDELYAALEQALCQDTDPYAEERRILRDRAFTHADGKAARRLGEYIVTRYLSGATPENGGAS